MEVWQIILVVLGAIIGAAIALALLYVLVVAIASLLVNTKKQYDKVDPFYHALLMIGGWLCMRIGRIKIRVRGKEKLPSGTFLLVQNHRSNFDPIVTAYALGRRKVAFVSKPSNFSIPLFGRIIRKLCYTPIDRENPREAMKTILRSAALIKSGAVPVAIYPEGTRNKSCEGLLHYHNGVFKIAQRADCPIVITTVTGTELIAKNFFRRRTAVDLTIVEVLPVERVKAESSAQLGEYARSVTAATLGIDLADEKPTNEKPTDEKSTDGKPTDDKTV